MAKLRLFANLREIAGTSRVDIPASTVSEVVDAAADKFGPEFKRGLETSRIWLNGEETDMEAFVGDDDEVVILPPVSGGSQPAAIAPADLVGFAPLLILVVAVLAALQGQAIWAAALVAIAGAWVGDLAAAFRARGKLFAPLAAAATAASGAAAAHVLGGSGYGLTVGLAVAICLGWAVAFRVYRQVDAFAPTLLVGLIGGLGTASLLLANSGFSPDDRAVGVFLVAVTAGVALGALVSRLPPMPFLDPFSTKAIAVVLGAVAAAAMWDADVVGYLLVGLGLAIALVAGNGLSSMVRMGRVSLTQRAPGALASLDGVVLAAALYYPLIRILLT
jgi:molybdopterin synthase sulfur carrier subunit